MSTSDDRHDGSETGATVGAHLGQRVSAFVDGDLDHGERDRALAHLAHCTDCRADVESERAIKARLGRHDGPYPPSSLIARLSAIPDVERAAVPQGPGPVHPRSRRDAVRPRGRRSGARRRRLALGSSGAFLVAALGTAFAVGGEPAGGPAVSPAVDRFAVEHVAVTDEVPLTDSGGSAVSVTFLSPTQGAAPAASAP